MSNYIKQSKHASDGKPALAISLAALCSSEQVRAIRHLSARLRIDENDISQSLFNCRYDELSKSGADDVLHELENGDRQKQHKLK